MTPIAGLIIFGLMIGLTGAPGSGNGLTCLRDLGTFFITRDLFETGEVACVTPGGEVVSALHDMYTSRANGDKLCLLAKLMTGTMAKSTRNEQKRCMLVLAMGCYKQMVSGVR